MVQDIPSSTLAQSATVIVHEKYFAPLPIQTTTEPLRDTLSVLTISSSLNYEYIPIKFAYVMDVKDCSSKDEMRTHIDLLSENRRRRRRLARKIKELAAKDKSLKAKKPEEQYRRNMIDQKIFTSTFT